MTLNTKKLMRTFRQQDEEDKHGRLQYRLRIQTESEAKKEILDFYRSECRNSVCYCTGECKKKDTSK